MKIKGWFYLLLFVFLFINTESIWAQSNNIVKERRREKKKRKKLSENNIQTAVIFNEPLKDTTITIIDTVASNAANTKEKNTIINEPEPVKETSATTIAESTNSSTQQQVKAAPKTHIAQENETLYTIARKYDIPVATLIKANKLSTTGIKEGQIVFLDVSENMPVNNAVPEKVISPNVKSKEQAIEAELVEQKNELEKKFQNLPSNTSTQTTTLEKPLQLEATKIKDENLTTHIAQENETLYTIARKYDIPVATLIKANKLSSTEIRKDQIIYLSVSPTSTTTTNDQSLKPISFNKQENIAAKADENKESSIIDKSQNNEQSKSVNTTKKLAPGTILIGCYAGHNNEAADILKNRLQEKGHVAGYLYIPDYEPQGKKMYRVYVGPYESDAAAKQALKQIQQFRPEAYIFKVK